MMVQGVGDVEDLIYSSRRELRRRLAEVSSGDTVAKLHLDERYAFDGTHSDFAQQFYRRYLAGDEAEPITDTSDLAEVVKYVKDEFGLNITELPAILQQAVVWDMGYVAAADLGYVKVYTKCGVRMSELQVTRSAYRSTGCIEQRCSSPNGELFYQSQYCNGYQMGNVSLCAATNGITPVHGSMWADGGTDDMVPVSNMQRHEWTDAGINYTIMAIHLAGDPNRYGKCIMPSMTIPCVAYDASTADESDWCSPKHGEIVPQWLELEKTGRAYVTESSGWQKAALPVTITSLVLLLLVLIAGFAFWRKTREKLRETEDILEQKRAILGGRGSDELSMVDDIDFILDTSVVEKDMGQQAWEAWKPLPVKPKQINRNSEDYDTVLLGGSFEGLIDTNDHEGSAHHRHLHNSIRSPSKATTAGLTSFASGGTGSRRDSLTLTFTRQSSSTDPVNSSSSTNPSSGTMITPLIEFQNDLAVSTRRVPFVDVSLVRQITAGAYGEVWLGRMRGDIVAVKRLTRERRRHLHELELFAAEIQLMASFAHSNVLGLLGVAWNTLENMLLIMEYVERGDLQHVLQYHNDRVLEEKVFDATNEFSWASHKGKIARDIACGLDYLHGLKPIVVHRDLKSKNVLIGESYEAKLSDFGVSRLRSGEETMTSGVGTPYWTAPEVLAGYRYSEKADVYSLGVVLTELDTGELPFYDARTSDGDKMETIHILSLVVSGKLQPSFTLDCPEDVRKLALACLNPKPECRPSAKEVTHELNRLLESEESPPVTGGLV
ncbi:TKL protein kinase [Phytophthora cinnamomi]|uniref:TKL protein kinase n=1 Tax=Phytophthora cinnamomi TaxID=4785 RepID=UPI003559CC42|nr:TKL protein kinase [Phytophthora cinnamomi]